MRPPICDVCGAGVEQDGGGLVRCLSSASDLAFRERMETQNMVGHPPDTGWFCARHAVLARELAPTMHLGAVLAAVSQADAGAGSGAEPAGASAGLGMGALYQRLRGLLPQIIDHLGLDPGSLTERTDRQWHPMDGSQPPDCPFADSTVHEAAHGKVQVTLRLDSSWWNQAEQARSDLSLSVRGAGQADFTVSAWSPASGAPDSVEGVKKSGNPPQAVLDVLEGLG